MNLDQLRECFPDEATCREFLESVIWANGPRCPHCGHDKSFSLQGKSTLPLIIRSWRFLRTSFSRASHSMSRTRSACLPRIFMPIRVATKGSISSVSAGWMARITRSSLSKACISPSSSVTRPQCLSRSMMG